MSLKKPEFSEETAYSLIDRRCSAWKMVNRSAPLFSESERQSVQPEMGADLAVISGSALCFADIFADLTTITPEILGGVVQAASRSGEKVTSFNDVIYELAEKYERNGSVPASWQGILNRLQGYVGEHLHVSHRIELGVDAKLANSANNPGPDAFEDNIGYGIKTTKNPGTIREDLEKYPSMNQVTSPEAKERYFPDDSRVVGSPALADPAAIRSSVNEAAEASYDMVNVNPFDDCEIPLVAAILCCGRETMSYLEGEKDIDAAVTDAFISTTTKTGGMMAGAKLGATIDLGLGGYGFGVPTLVGAVSGGMAGSSVFSFWTKRHLRRARVSLKWSLVQLGRQCNYHWDSIHGNLQHNLDFYTSRVDSLYDGSLRRYAMLKNKNHPRPKRDPMLNLLVASTCLLQKRRTILENHNKQLGYARHRVYYRSGPSKGELNPRFAERAGLLAYSRQSLVIGDLPSAKKTCRSIRHRLKRVQKELGA